MHIHGIKTAGFALAIAAAALVGCQSGSGKSEMKAQLAGTQEVPPNATRGTGAGTFNFDPSTKQLQWNVNYAGLTGPVTGAHIHGPAGPGTNAGIMVPFQNVGTSPITGTATLTDAQAQALTSGQTYVNIHTAANPAGEIRGQITK
jgi:Cu/Zn superoxide dismutase